jgi:protein TonB
MASYPGGMDSLEAFISKNFVHPKSYESVYAKVYIRFKVDTNGKVSDFKILRSSHKEYSEEALRVLPLMPNWVPAENQGKVVPSYFTLPLRFRLE